MRTEFLPPPPVWNLRGLNPAGIRSFAEKARAMALPSREYAVEVRARAVAEKYADALKIVKHTPVRTIPDRSLLATNAASDPEPPIALELWTSRIDSLFEILDSKFPTAITRLWNLSHRKENPFQARDALFAGVGALRAAWPYTASMGLERSIHLKIKEEPRYYAVLWQAMQQIGHHQEILHLTRLLGLKPGEEAPAPGDLPFYLLARENPSFFAQVTSTRLQEQLLLEQSLTNLAKNKIPEARTRLEQLLLSPAPQVRSQAAINLARLHVREGRPSDALLIYGQVEKNGRNRMDLLIETSWAEFRAGEFQGSLGKAIALQSPYFRFGWAPEAYVLETLGRKNLCDFGGAQKTLLRFQEDYGPELAFVQSIAAGKRGDLYDEVLRSFHAAAPRRFERYLLSLPETISAQEFISGLGRELRELRSIPEQRYAPAVPDDWDAFLLAERSHFESRITTLKKGLVERWQAEARYQGSKLSDVFRRFDLIQLDVASRAAADIQIQSALNYPVAAESVAPEKRGRMLWPYHQEVWEDELDFLKVRGEGECANRFTASTPEEEEPEDSAPPPPEPEGASHG
ncbi:MAG: hypothetical protein HUU37_10555 [Bdellovibrionales bacterium]|nr:hypothetical protein [Bdellovibrionales bacterium]